MLAALTANIETRRPIRGCGAANTRPVSVGVFTEVNNVAKFLKTTYSNSRGPRSRKVSFDEAVRDYCININREDYAKLEEAFPDEGSLFTALQSRFMMDEPTAEQVIEYVRAHPEGYTLQDSCLDMPQVPLHDKAEIKAKKIAEREEAKKECAEETHRALAERALRVKVNIPE